MVESSPKEAFAKIIFIQFNPLIRRLCETVQSYHACRDAKPKLPLLVSIANLLDLLQDQLNWLVSSGAGKEDISYAIHLISDFLTLPLRSMLCRISTWEMLRTVGNKDENEVNSRAAVQSSIWKCIERTSRILQHIVGLSVELQKDAAKIKMFLAAYAEALPSHEVAEQTTSACAMLDKGEFCLESIYKAAGIIIRLGNMSTFSDEVVRLLDIAVTLLEPSTGDKSNDKSQKVQLLAISFISTCLDQFRNSHDWRKVFPATYAALYRRILKYPLESKSRPDASHIANISIQCISKLFRVAISKRSTRASSIAERLKEMSNSANGNVDESDTPEKFLVESRRLLPPTVIVLSDLITVNFPNSLKVSFLKLCHVLLIEINDLSESGDYRRKILESVLLHLRDRDELVKQTAEATLKAYTETNVDALDFIGARIVELIENLGAFALENQGSKLDDTLRLVSNYIFVLECDKGLRAATRSLFSSESFRKTLMQNFAILYDPEFHTRSSGRQLITVLDRHISHGATQYKYIQRGQIQLVDGTVEAIGRLLGRKRSVLVMDSCFSDMYRSSLSGRGPTIFRSEQQKIEWLRKWSGCFPFLRRLQAGAFPDMHHYLGKLATAILPVLVTSSLWSLPTHCPQQGGNHSASIYHGNTKFTLLMLEFVADLVRTLDCETLQPIIPSLLPSVLEKLRDGVQEDIRAAGNRVFIETSTSLGFQDPSAMLVENIEGSFLPHVIGCLRLAEKKSVSRINGIDSGLKSVVELSCVVFHVGSEFKDRSSPSTLLPSIHRFVSTLARRFDLLDTPCRDDDKTALLFARLFNEAIGFSLHLRTQAQPIVTVNDAFMAEDEPWFRLLRPFLVSNEYRQNAMAERQCCRSINEQQSLLAALKDDTEFIDQMTWRLGYLLSHSNLTVQRRAFECLERSFCYLGWIASLCSEFAVEEHNGPKTAILRQIHASWSTIETRMKAATTTVVVNNAATLLAQPHVEMTSHPGVPEHRHVLSSLFTLVATICEVSDDFLASRWRPSVWPCLRQVFEASIRRFGRKFEGHATALRQESEVTLLKSAMDSVTRVYRHSPTGRALSGLIPESGSLLLPFVSCGDTVISQHAFSAIESLVSIDGDALYRPLLEHCGGELKKYSWETDHSSIAIDETSTAELRKLFEHVKSRREQDIV